MGKETFFQQLPVQLTEEELKQRGKDLAKTHQDISEVERHKKEINDDFKAKLSALDATTGTLSRAISNGYEYREVECEWAYFWEKGEKHMIRLDTGETVEIRKIEQWERQASSNFDGGEELPPAAGPEKKQSRKQKQKPEVEQDDFPNEDTTMEAAEDEDAPLIDENELV